MPNKKDKKKQKKIAKISYDKKIRYAVVGLGYIAQKAVLAAFSHASNSSELIALISDDTEKLEVLGKEYGVKELLTYDDYDTFLDSDTVDAVYLALPNSLHLDFAIRAFERGKHVLCEKPLALTTRGCKEMIEAAHAYKVKLMTAYRLHFEEATLKTIELVKKGTIGEPRIFHSVFSYQIKDQNIRLEKKLGGGTVYDLGIYCINAARHLFQDEPEEVFATATHKTDARFTEVDEMTSAILRFPGGALATFTSSFGAADRSHYEVIGTKGSVRMEPAYEYAEGLKQSITINNKTVHKKFKKVDQFAPELIYFSECILNDVEPEPSGLEGLADVRIIQAIRRSVKTGEAIRLSGFKKTHPTLEQSIQKPPIKEPELFKAYSPAVEEMPVERSFSQKNGYYETRK